MLQIQIIPFFTPVTLIVVGTLLLVGVTLAFYVLVYFLTKVSVYRNPWVRDVKHMSWLFSPAFNIWYFIFHRHKWAAYWLTVSTVLLGIPFWWALMLLNSISFIPTYGAHVYYITAASSLILGILLLIAIGYILVRHHAPKKTTGTPKPPTAPSPFST